MPNDTPLHKACHNGELDAVKKLIEGGEYEVNEGMYGICVPFKPKCTLMNEDGDTNVCILFRLHTYSWCWR